MEACSRTIGATVCALALLAVVASFATTAAAEPFPAQHFSLVPVSGEPLKKGFVEVIHPDGPQVYAHQVYEVNGAGSNQSYEAVISIWTSNLACAGDPALVLPAAVVDTNPAGNGEADAVFTPELLDALGIRGLTIGGNVTLYREGLPAYSTGCNEVELD